MSLKIISWNANSITGKHVDLLDVLRSTQAHIVLLQETRLALQDPSPPTPGYEWHRRERPNGNGGGVAVLVHESVSFTPTDAPVAVKLAEFAGGTLHTPAGPLFVGSVYLPPSKARKGEIGNLLTVAPHFFLGGDLNAHWRGWGSVKDNQAGAYVNHWLNALSANLHVPPENTRVSTANPQQDAVLDYGISHEALQEVRTEVLPLLSSDHRPVLFTLSALSLHTPPSYRISRDWDGIREELAAVQWPTSIPASAEGVNEAAEHLEAVLQASLLNNTKYIRLRNAASRLLPPHIVTLQKRKKDLLREFVKTRDRDTKAEANKLSRTITKEVRVLEERRLQDQVSALDSPTGRWRFLKSRGRKPFKAPSMCDQGGRSVYDDQGKANLIAASLATRFNEHPGFPGSPEADAFAPPPPTPGPDIPGITEEEIRITILASNPNKAAGHDCASNKILKLIPAAGILFLAILFNTILHIQTYPETWKRAVVIPLPKPGKNPADPANYRPISLLPCISKVFEKCLLIKLLPIASGLGAIPDHQMGFRKGHSTTHQLVRVADHLVRAWNDHKTSYMITLDVEAAFDRVPHKYLLFKLTTLGFPAWFVAFICSYFTNRLFAVRLGDALSDSFSIAAGTPQGSILSPLLFILYIADMPAPTPAQGIIAQYADDTCYIVSAASQKVAEMKTQVVLRYLEGWCSRWKTKINAAKSTAMRLHNSDTYKKTAPPASRLVISGEVIPEVTSCKYLGLMFDQNLRWDVHFQYMRTKAAAATTQLLSGTPNIRRCAVQTRQQLFHSLIRPILTYGMPTFLGAPTTYKNLLMRYEMKWLKIIHNLPPHTRNKKVTDITTFPLLQELSYTFATKYHANNSQHPNPLIKHTARYHPQLIYTKQTHKTKLLPLQVTMPLQKTTLASLLN